MRHLRLWVSLALAALLAGLALVLSAGPAAAATTYYCANDYSVDDPGLQAAIDGGGTINVVGHCLGNWDIENSETLQGIGNAILDGDQAGRVLEIEGPLTVTIRSLTITGGTGGDGAGILDVHGGTLTLQNVVVTGNQACDTCFGGGIEAGNLTLTLIGTTVSQNFAGQGGGLNPYDGSQTTITGSSIVSNVAANLGGGIYNEPCCGTSLTLTSSRVAWNTAAFTGGGIENDQSELQVLGNSSIDHNTAGYAGGGIYNSTSVNVPELIASGKLASHGALASQAHVQNHQPLPSGDSEVIVDSSSVSLNRVINGGIFVGGGGIYNLADEEDTTASVVATNMRLGGNLAKLGFGGGVVNINIGGDAALVTLQGTAAFRVPAGSLNDNQAELGGAVFNAGLEGTADVAFQNKTAVVHNRASQLGGGLLNFCGGTFSIAPGTVFQLNSPQNIVDLGAFCGL